MATKRLRLFPRSQRSTKNALACVRRRLAILTMMMVAALITGAGSGCQNDGQQHWAHALFEHFAPASPEQVVREALDPYDADQRHRAVSQLAAAPFGGEGPYVRLYRLLTSDEDAAVRAAAAKALGMHGEVEDAELLTPLLNDEQSFVRWEAAKALQRIHHPAAVGPLIRTVRDDADTDVRMAAAHALGQYPEPGVLDVLIGALNDREFSVVNAAHESLTTLTGTDQGIDSRQWLAWSRDNRGERFANRKPYRFHPYDPPPSLVERMRFWSKHSGPEPRTPVGLDETESGDDAT